LLLLLFSEKFVQQQPCLNVKTIALSLVASTDCFTPRGPGFMAPNGGGNVNGDSSLESSMLETTRNSWSPVFPTPAPPMPKETTVAAVPKMAQRWRKSTKQLTTLGPASSNKEMIEKILGGCRCL
jgi:hypothetical protein